MFRESLILPIGNLIRFANDSILEKDQLTTIDVKGFLQKQLEIEKVINFSAPRPPQNNLSISTRIDKLLGNWDLDRSESLFTLIYVVSGASKEGDRETMEASKRCAITLVQEPIVPSCDPNFFGELVEYSLEMAHKTHDLVYLSTAAGIQYNASRFCPQLFRQEITDELVLLDKINFLSSLQVLSGEVPFIQ